MALMSSVIPCAMARARTPSLTNLSSSSTPMSTAPLGTAGPLPADVAMGLETGSKVITYAPCARALHCALTDECSRRERSGPGGGGGAARRERPQLRRSTVLSTVALGASQSN